MILIRMIKDGELVMAPGIDMAFQEYVREKLFFEDDIILPYRTTPQVQMGRYQNAHKEVNQEALEELGVDLVRRDTGGGAIYLDEGNTSFCFLFENKNYDTDLNFKMVYAPVIKILRDMGADVELSGRNDLAIDGKKISGCAMSVIGDRTYAGFSLQLDVNEEAMNKVLTPNRKKLQAKGIDSVRSRVQSIRPHLDSEFQDMTQQEFHDYVGARIMGLESYEEAEEYTLTSEDWQAIEERAQEKYLNWDWVYGQNPKYSYQRDIRIEGIGTIDVEAEIKNERIADIKFYGDFFGNVSLEPIENALQGTPMRREDLLDVLNQFELKAYFGGEIQEELVDLLLS